MNIIRGAGPGVYDVLPGGAHQLGRQEVAEGEEGEDSLQDIRAQLQLPARPSCGRGVRSGHQV